MPAMTLRNRISWEIQSEEGLFDQAEHVSAEMLQSIIEEVIDYLKVSEGYEEDGLLEDSEQIALSQEIIILFYYLRHKAQSTKE